MRIGKRFAGAVASSIAAGVFAIVTMGAAAERVQPVPLGGSLGDQSGDKSFGVYVPTKFGGVLSIKTSILRQGTTYSLLASDSCRGPFTTMQPEILPPLRSFAVITNKTGGYTHFELIEN